MCQKLVGKDIVVNTLDWLPDRYPAFPITSSSPLQLFLCLATAIHGYADGVLTLLQEIFTTASRADEAELYVDELKKMLE